MAGLKDENVHTARREAHPISWEELTPQQREAATQACRILGDIAAQTPRPEEDTGSKRSVLRRFLPPIDPDRLNHVVLLDGGRGAGKTALLITLLNLWNQRLLQQTVDPGVPEELLNLSLSIVPVGLIDLQPLPPSTNLLLHLVGQFLPVVESLEEQGRGSPEAQRSRTRALWHDVDVEKSPATRAWQGFLRAAAMGWDGSLPERRARLDPEAYALELEQTERRRLDVRRCFREFIDALVNEWPQLVRLSGDTQPLFVIPIDDADMNPERVVELLDLLRTLWHPRVAFLLTGDSQLFLSVLRAHSLAALRAPLRDVRAFSRDDIHTINSIPPTRLAEDIYNKVIPDAHRCQISELSPEESFEILRRDGALRLIPAPHDQVLKLESFEQYLDLQPQTKVLLPSNLRLLNDFADKIYSRIGLIRVQSSDLGTGSMLSHGLSGRRRVTLVVVNQLINSKYFALSVKEPAGVPLWRFDLSWAEQVSTEVDFFRCYRDEPGFDASLPGGIAAVPAQIAAVVLTADAGGGRAEPESPIGLLSNVVWAELKSDKIGRLLRFPWALPTWRRPIEYSVFIRLWCMVRGKYLDLFSQGRAPGGVGWEGRAFLAAVMGYIELRCERARSNSDGVLPFSQAMEQLATKISQNVPTWSTLAADLSRMADSRSAIDAPEAVWWARHRAGLLAAPESGLSQDDANEFLDALTKSFAKDWEQVGEWLRVEQRRRLASANESVGVRDKELDGIISMIRQEYPGYAWYDRVLLEAKRDGDNLRNIFSDVELATPEGIPRKRLGNYLSEGRVAEIAAAAPDVLLERWRDNITAWRGSQGMAPLLVPAMWQDAVALGLVPDLVELKGRVMIPALLKLYDRMGSPWHRRVDSDFMQVGPELLLAKMHCGWDQELWPESPLAKPLFEFLWDVLIDINDREAGWSIHDRWWSGVGAGSMSRRTPRGHFPWPYIDWPTFIEDRVFVGKWNEIVGLAVRAAELAPDEVRVADDLAYWYVHAIADLVYNGSVNHWWRGSVPVSELAELIGIQVQRGVVNPASSHRWAAYAAWCRMVPIFAAPESGLTKEAATAILSYRTVADIAPEQLRVLRRSRLHHLKAGKSRVESILQRIDETNMDHPWVTLIEQRK